MHILTLAGFLLPGPAATMEAPVPPLLVAPLVESGLSAASTPLNQESSAPAPAPGSAHGVGTDSLFAPATEALAFAWPEESGGLTLLDIMQSYGLTTGQRLSIDHETREVLKQTLAPLDRATTVPSAEVQGFVEALLRSANCVLTVDRSSEPRLVGVHSLSGQRRSYLRSRAISIDSSKTGVLRQHPAVFFSTVVHLPNSDVRQLSNSLRTLITDSNTAQMLPAGSGHSMVLVGFGTSVANRIEELLAIDGVAQRVEVTISHELVRLNNAVAAEIAPLVEMALTTSRELRSPSSKGQAQGPKGPPRSQFSVLAESRLNGLLVTCRSEDMEEARAVIAQLDVN